jgi:hypothetical protein
MLGSSFSTKLLKQWLMPWQLSIDGAMGETAQTNTPWTKSPTQQS